jgi:serine/threonine protein kinase
MSPEQAQGKPVDSRSDVFGFGCVLYEMLTGQRAFDKGNPVATLAAILHDDPAPIDPNVAPRPLLRLVAKCLRKQPDDRWQHMSDVKQLLDDAAKDEESRVAGPAEANPAATDRAAGSNGPRSLPRGRGCSIVFVGSGLPGRCASPHDGQPGVAHGDGDGGLRVPGHLARRQAPGVRLGSGERRHPASVQQIGGRERCD